MYCLVFSSTSSRRPRERDSAEVELLAGRLGGCVEMDNTPAPPLPGLARLGWLESLEERAWTNGREKLCVCVRVHVWRE